MISEDMFIQGFGALAPFNKRHVCYAENFYSHNWNLMIEENKTTYLNHCIDCNLEIWAFKTDTNGEEKSYLTCQEIQIRNIIK